MASLPELVVLGLATWRLTSLVVAEEGPWNVFGHLRYRLGIRFDERSQPYGTNELAKLLTCVWCTSPWIAAGVSLAYWWTPQVTLWVMLPFALSAIAIVLQGIVDGDSS